LKLRQVEKVAKHLQTTRYGRIFLISLMLVMLPCSGPGWASDVSEAVATGETATGAPIEGSVTATVPAAAVPLIKDRVEGTSAEAVKTDPRWKSPLASGNDSLPKLIEAISGKKNSEETAELLRGVVRVSRSTDGFSFKREDDQELEFGSSTILGGKMLESLEKTQRDTDKYGANLGEVVSGLSGVSVNGNHVELLRSGPTEVKIPVSAGVKKIPFKLKEVRLGQLSMDLDESKGFPAIRNITGLEVIVSAGIDLHIVLKEFWRTKNDAGDTTVTFGIVNPLPKALRAALGLKEISYFSHTIRKKKERAA